MVKDQVNVVTPSGLNMVYGESNEINGEKNCLLLIRSEKNCTFKLGVEQKCLIRRKNHSPPPRIKWSFP